MTRALAATAFLLALWPASVTAAPSPSPSLQSILLAPPAGFAATPSYPYQGHMSALDFAATWGPDTPRGQSLLATDGFVDGYGMAWTQKSTGHQLFEFALAFTGASGAEQWLGSDKVENLQSVGFVRQDAVTGIPLYSGVHMTRSSPPGVLDGFEFVKGNDVLGVAVVSARDDVLALAQTEARNLYNSAPIWTIPESQWPESIRAAQLNGSPDFGVGQALFVGVLVVGALFVAGVFVSMRRSEARPKAAPAPAYRLSEDGNYWWGGNDWVPTSVVAPPWAKRSPTGSHWWDGHAWRPDPQVVQQVRSR